MTDSGQKQPVSGDRSSSSEGEADAESDFTSSSGSSSEDEEDTSPPRTWNAPQTHGPVTGPLRDNELRSRIAAFLPQIERSNRELERNGDLEARAIDNVDETEENYVEMNLSLGVLSERTSNAEEVISRKDSSDDEASSSAEERDKSKTSRQPQSDQHSRNRPRIQEI